MTTEQAAAFRIEETKHEVLRLQRILRDCRATSEDIRIAEDQLADYTGSLSGSLSAAKDGGPAELRGTLSSWPFSSKAGAR
jgi:hypothetical protein